MFHPARLVVVGRQSIDALARKESWTPGKPNIRRFHTCVDSSRGIISRIEFVLHRDLADLVVPL